VSIPAHWKTATLAEVAEVLDSRRIPVNAKERAKRLGPVPYYGATGRVGWIDEALFDEELVLLGEDGAPFLDSRKPKAYRISGPAWVNNHAHVLRARPVTTNLFLKFVLDSADYRPFVRGTTRLKLTQKDMRAIPIPLPPLNEQQRIVATLEEQFSRLDAAEASLEGALMRVRSAWRAGVASLIHPAWPEAPVGEVAQVRGGILKNPSRRPVTNTAPFLRVANVLRGKLDLSDVHRIELFEGDLAKYVLEPGDLLIVEGNGSVDQIGRSAVWDGSIAGCVHQNHLIRLRPSEALLPEFLGICWNSPILAGKIRAAANSTSGLYTLSTGKVSHVLVPVPPLPEQERAVQRYEALVTRLTAVEREIRIGLGRSRHLRSALLREAFAGRLVNPAPDLATEVAT